MNKLLVMTFSSLVLMGCATLNKPECQNADWRMIGMEDGAKGLLPVNIRKHRIACAKYNITPDLDEYTIGHRQGLTQFCNPLRGYEMGQRGIAYNGVCPEALEGPFLESFDRGQVLRSKLEEINRIVLQIKNNKRNIEDLRGELTEKKKRLISGVTTEGDRARLVDEIEKIQDNINSVEDKIHRLKRTKEQRETELTL
jgi:hypothetical protein